MKIYLNAGHDRLLDSGAVNEAMGLRECDLAYELAQKVKGYLERNGVAVLFGQQDTCTPSAVKPTTPRPTPSCPCTSTRSTSAPPARKRSSPIRQRACFWACDSVQHQSRPQPARPRAEGTAGPLRPAQYGDACRRRRSVLYRQRLRHPPVPEPRRRRSAGHRHGNYAVAGNGKEGGSITHMLKEASPELPRLAAGQTGGAACP